MIRICLISNQFAAWGKMGGFGVSSRRLACGLVDRGYEVHAVVPRRAGQPRVTRLDGVTVHGLSVSEVFFGTGLYRSINADIFHVMEPNLCGYHAQTAVPEKIHLVTSIYPLEMRERLIEFRYTNWWRRLQFPLHLCYEDGMRVRRSVRRAHGVYVEADLLASKVQSLYRLPKIPELLPKPIPIPNGRLEKSSRPEVVFLGRFDRRKRPEIFLRLAERMPGVHFVAVGEAHRKRDDSGLRLKYGSLPNLELTGYLDPFRDGRISEILSRSWILVHPAVNEGLPTAFQEASAHEMAILASVDPGGYTSRFGRTVAANASMDQWETALREMISSGRWRQQGRAGREFNQESHSIPVSLDRHEEVYRGWIQD